MSQIEQSVSALVDALVRSGGDLAPVFVSSSSRFTRLKLMVNTAVGLSKRAPLRSSISVTGKLWSSDEIDISLAEGNVVRDVLRGFMHGQASLTFSVKTGHRPIEEFCDHLGIDTTQRLAVKILTNPIYIVFGTVKMRPAVVHVGVAESGKSAISAHHEGLSLAAVELQNSRLKRLIPTILQHNPNSGFLVQSRLSGVSIRPRHIQQAELHKAIYKGLDVLTAIHVTRNRVVDRPDVPFLDSLFDMRDKLPFEFRSVVEGALSTLRNWPGYSTLPGVFAHGDFWLPNILFDKKQQISGLIDWELARRNALPGFDAVKLIFMSVADHRGQALGRVMSQMWNEAARESWVADLLKRVREQFQLEEGDLARIGVAVLLGTIRHSYIDTAGPPRTWLRDMLEYPIASLHNSTVLK